MPAEQQARKRALITGLSGQDGSYLAELLLEKGYEVVGLIRGDPANPLGAAEHLREQLRVIRGDLTDPDSLIDAVASVSPHELYHLAAPSFVPASWQHPTETFQAIAGSCATLLEAVRDHSPATRMFVASSGAIFGAALESPQKESTRCLPETPYATAKLAAHLLTGQMRTQAGLFACSGILYNHESERRPEPFVTRKVTKAAAAIKLGLQERVKLGSLDAVRDWSFAPDVMQGAWLMLQQEQPSDFILASGVGHTVAELADAAFAHLGLRADQHIEVEPELQRPTERTPLVGDPDRARRVLGWQATLTFEQLISRMVDADLAELQAGGRT